MAQTNVSIRMDNDLKESFENLCNEMGLTMTSAINVFVKKVVRDCRIPFEIGVPKPNEETLAAVREVQEMKKNPALGKAYSDVDSMMKELLA